MKQDLERQARELASRPYLMMVKPDETTDGEPGYVAMIPELPGCMSGGDTWQEALKNLRDAQLEYILSLLEDGLPVPAPSWANSITTTAGGQASTLPVEEINPHYEPRGAEQDLVILEFREVILK